MNAVNKTNFITSLYRQHRPTGNTNGLHSGAPGDPHAGPHSPPAGLPEDRVTFSKAALAKKDAASSHPAANSQERELSSEELQAVNEMKQRDQEVKAHESAHMAAGGGIVQGGASYQYASGPDGKMYAVGGEVKIDVSSESTPDATIQKMQQVRAAALAPAHPSGTDRSVAAQASQVEAQARIEKTQENQEDEKDPNIDAQGVDPDSNMPAPNTYAPPGSRINFMA